MIRGTLAVLASAATLLLVRTPVLAAAPVAPTGLTVSPAIEQISLGAGQDTASFSVQVTNNFAHSITIATTIDDFTALNTSGGVQFLNNTGREPAPHGLAHWLTAGATLFDLPPDAARTVPVTVSHATTMAPGGHYGAVIFKLLPAATAPQTNRIGTNAEVSVLVFLTAANAGREAITLLKPTPSPASVGIPNQVDVVFHNSGDVQTTPRGVVIITDSTNQEVGRGTINPDSGLVLPGTDRLYEVAIKVSGQHFWPGLYHLNIFYRAGGQTHGNVLTTAFFYISQPMVVALGVLPCLGFLILVRRLNAYVIRYRINRGKPIHR